MPTNFWIILFGIFGLATSASASSSDSLTLDSTRLVTVGNVSTEGNFRTRTTIILREMAISPGDTLPLNILNSRLEIDRRKIVNTNLFITVEMIPLFQSADSTVVDIRVLVKERLYFVVLPIFELADRNFNEWWYDRNHDLRRTTYGLFMSYRNLTGRADRLLLSANFGFIPKYEMSYSIPYIDKALKTGVTAGVSYTTNKSLAYRTWNDKLDFLDSEVLNRERFYTFVNFTRRNKFYEFHSLDTRWVHIQLSDSLARLNPTYLLKGRTNQQYFQLTYTYKFDRRDNVQYPLLGFLYGIQASKLGILPSDNINQSYLYGYYRRFIPLSERWFFNTGITGRVSSPKLQPYAQRIGLGFREDLVRGYELNVIEGQHYLLWGNELKYRLFSFQKTIPWIPVRQLNTIPVTAYLNSFADLGYVRNYFPELSSTSLGNRPLVGAGLGLDVVTFYNMVIRLNYTVNSQGQDRLFFQIGRSL